MKYKILQDISLMILAATALVSAQLVSDPLPYAPIANPLPDTMDQLYRDSINLKFSTIRINQAGYRPQDKKYFYYIGSGGSSFSVINETGTSVGNGTLQSTGSSVSSQLKIKASNNAQLVHNGDTRYTMESQTYAGSISEGRLPPLAPGVYRVVVGSTTSAPFVVDERLYSWVRDALLKFYGVNRCGDSQSWFHPPCHLKDPVTGGWHDCGDHLKEGATMGYTASVLGLAAAVFADRDVDVYSANQGITQITDGIPDILYEAKHGADFILRSYDLAGGQVGNMITCVGDTTSLDHSWWGRPENQDNMPASRGGPPRIARHSVTSDYLGNYAANLAFVSKKIRQYDSTYANRCLTAAKALYNFTKNRRDLTNTPWYNGANSVHDDLAFACLALLWATGERAYLNELCFDKTIGTMGNTSNPKVFFEGGWFVNKDPLFYHGMANTDWGSTHAHVLWGFFRLVLNDETFCTQLGLSEAERLGLIEKTVYNFITNLSSAGSGSQSIVLPSTGVWVESTIKYDLPWFTMHTQREWVWNRYQAGNITEMYYYYDIASKIQGLKLPNTPASTDWKAEEIQTILVRMLDYQLGVNPWDISMIYGIGEKNFNHPHHRAANPEGKNVPGAFYRYRPPVGALQGGYIPTTSVYDEFWADYFHSETGIDGTTNILMPVIGLAKEDTLGPPSATVRIIYVGCDEAIIEIRQSRFGNADVRYGTGAAPDKVQRADSSGVLHRIALKGLTNGTTYYFDVVVTDLFGRDSVIKYLDEEKKLVYFTFTTLQNCPNDATINNVKICRVTHDSAEIFWYTPNGEFDSKVVYGEQKPPTMVHEGDVAGHPVKFHYVKIGGLKEQTTYYFYVESGESRDDNNGQLYQFTTPVEHVDFDVRTLRYTWQEMTTMGMNIVNQDKKAYDSLDVRIYFRAKEGFENDLGARMDIGIVYKEDGYQSEFSENSDIRYNIMHSRPVKMEDTYDPADQTFAYYFSVPLWGVEMRSGSRIRLDIVFDRRSPWPPYEDLMNQAPEHVITDRDWSFGPHSRANGDPVDFPGVPNLPKDNVDSDYWDQPINYYVTIYRKGEYVWGYSPSQAEMQTKKNYYIIQSQVTSPLQNPSADYVFYERPIRLVEVSGWAIVQPVDGTLNEIWVNGIKQTNSQSLFRWNEDEDRYDFTVEVPVQNGRNNVDITLFAGPPIACVDCYGCAVSNHHFFIEFQGAKQVASVLVLRDEGWQPMSDTVRLDTTKFHVKVTDPNGNQNGKATDVVKVWIRNFDNGDSLEIVLFETGGDSTGVFQTIEPIAVVDRTPAESGPAEIAMNGGDRVRIWYVDPTDPTDSSEAFITSKANFPLARGGWLTDSDGDGAVDRMVVEYSTPLKENVDSILVNFPNAASATMARSGIDEMTFAANAVTVRFAKPFPSGITSFTSALYTSGTSYLTSTGLVKASVFQVYDSIGPVLNHEAIVRERLEAGNDTITITLSESIRLDNFKGEVLLLRREGADVPITVLGIVSSETGSYTMTLICDAGGMQFAQGDSLRLNGASELLDLSGNRPHQNNRPVPVVIKTGVPRVMYAYYLDADVNGKIDLIRMGFSKPVVPEELIISLQWNKNTPVVIENGRISLIPGSSNDITIAVDSLLTDNDVVTSGWMRSAVVQKQSTLDTVFSDVADSAAPVIGSARFSLYNGDITKGEFVDTLRIVFSEPIRPDSVEKIRAFNLRCAYGDTPQNYTFNVSVTASDSGYRWIGEKEYLFFGRVHVVDYPKTGDLIWLQPESKVTDSKGNIQKSENNRRVPVIVDEVTFSLKDVDRYSGPNPFNPNAETFVLTLRLKASRFPFQLDSSARAIIYDAVGSVVTEITSTQAPAGVRLQWNGTNKKGRIVGNGSYLLCFSFKGEKERIMVGVMRK
ncbi:MAG: glycoside hydrolase family 9 protein [Chitinispirillaceae bacterium]|nr:glycoside hydrolase family 9 protein [Chitinispirillaceae bacterium]